VKFASEIVLQGAPQIRVMAKLGAVDPIDPVDIASGASGVIKWTSPSGLSLSCHATKIIPATAGPDINATVRREIIAVLRLFSTFYRGGTADFAMPDNRESKNRAMPKRPTEQQTHSWADREFKVPQNQQRRLIAQRRD
jgi:hypothetical protein